MFILLCCFLLCSVPTTTYATVHSIHVEWSYEYTPIDGRTLVGFALYKENIEVAVWNTPDKREGDCLLEADSGEYNFTLVAIMNDDVRSPMSDVYKFTLQDTVPKPVMLINIK